LTSESANPSAIARGPAVGSKIAPAVRCSAGIRIPLKHSTTTIARRVIAEDIDSRTSRGVVDRFSPYDGSKRLRLKFRYIRNSERPLKMAEALNKQPSQTAVVRTMIRDLICIPFMNP